MRKNIEIKISHIIFIFALFFLPFIFTTSVEAAVGDMTTYTGTGPIPSGIAFDGTNMWTTNYGSNSVTRITPTGGMTTYTGTGISPSGIAFDGTNMWVTNYSVNGGVTRVTPAGVMTTYAGTASYGIAFDGTNMWIADSNGDSVTNVTPAGVMTTYAGTGNRPYGIAFDGTNMWMTNYENNSVTRITPAGVMTTYTGTGNRPYGIAFDGTNMWTANVNDNSVTRITPAGVMTTYTGTGLQPHGIAFDGTNMWTTNYGSNSVTRITPAGVMTTYTGTGYQPRGIAFDGTNMWVTNSGEDSMTKIEVVAPTLGTITTTANTIFASWTITGPATLTGTGLSATYPAQPLGLYTITWGAVPGYTTPPPESKTLDGFVPPNFSGNYTVAPTITANITYPPTPLTVPVGTLVNFSGAGSPFAGGPSVVGNYSLNAYPTGVAFDPSTNSIWVVRRGANIVTKLNATNGAIINSYPVYPGSFEVIFDPSTNSIWVAGVAPLVQKISAATGVVLGSYPVGDAVGSSGVGIGAIGYRGITFDSSTNSIWVTNYADSSVTKLNAANGAVIGTYTNTLQMYRPQFITFDPSTNSIWVANRSPETLVKLDAATGNIIGVTPLGSGLLTYDPSTNSIWAPHPGLNQITKVNAATGAVIGTYAVGAFPWSAIFDPSTNSIWVANKNSSSVTQLDSTNGATLGTFPTGLGSTHLAFDAFTNSIWVTNWDSQTVTKISTGVDPATAYEWREGNCTTGTLLSTSASFSTTLSAGSHTVYLRVQDSSGTWSTNCPSRVITVSGASPSDLKICPASSAVGNGFTTQLRAYYVATGTVNCADTSTATEVTDLLNWTSSNPGVATVNNTTQKGLITGNSIGVSTISTDTHLGSPSTPIVITVLCVPTGTCSDPGPSATAAVLCPATSFGIPDGCGGTVTCFGTRSCDFNWKEVGQ